MMNFTAKESKYSKFYNKDMSLFGAFPRSDSLRLSLTLPRRLGVTSVSLLIHPDALDFPDDGESEIPLKWAGLHNENELWQAEVDLTALCGENGEKRLFYYRYRAAAESGDFLLGGEEPEELLPAPESGDRQLLVFDSDFKTSEKLKEGIIYHIFVDRFKKSGKCSPRGDAIIDPDWENGIPVFAEKPGDPLKNNVFFGGDLYGVIEELDYIASLGTKTIYLSPVFEAESNHKYDTGDYLKVDSMFGGDEALTKLCKAAKEKGISVILDGVFNHTGSNSVYFNAGGSYPETGAAQSKASPYYEWYSFKSYPDDYACWWGVKILPRVNSDNPSYMSFIFNRVIPKWMNAGVYGWRLDVADELSDRFLLNLRKTVKDLNPDAPIIGEVWEDATNKIAYDRRRIYMRGGELDSVMNYPLRDAVIDYIRCGNAEGLRKTACGLYRRYPKQASDAMMNFLSTHDTQRILTVLGGREQGELTNLELSTLKMNKAERKNAVRLLKAAFALVAALPGVPCVFYGDEAGAEGYRDPFCRRPYPWHNQEKELLEFYRAAGTARAGEPLFASGLLRIVEATPEHFVFKRLPFNGEDYHILCVINRSERDYPLEFPAPTTELISGETACSFTLPPMGAGWFKVKKSAK